MAELTLTMCVRLSPTRRQADALAALCSTFADCCNDVADYVDSTHTLSQKKINKAIYHQLRETHGLLAQMTQSAIRRVIANYKETQVEKLHVGQKVVMTVDAFEGKEFEGRISAISGATGSKYSLVPTDNSAGNFVKIQQRVPVRIEFVGISKEDNEKLAAGMMVIVKAQLK